MRPGNPRSTQAPPFRPFRGGSSRSGGLAAGEALALFLLGAAVVARLATLAARHAALALLFVGGAVLVAAGLLFAFRRRIGLLRRRQRSDLAPARWARPGELGSLCVRSSERGRVVLGRAGRSLLACERNQSVVVVGPTQSQKTSGIAVPAILEWDGPVIATSVKTDLVRDTARWRETGGDVLVYDPAAVTGLARAGWSPLAASITWPGARRVASALCSVGRAAGGGGLEDATFWYSMAEKLLAPLLFAASSVGATMADVCRWVDTGEESEVMLALRLVGVEEATRAAAASFGREERQRGSVFATAESVLGAFSDPSVLASASTNEIVPARLLDGGSATVYLCAPSHEQERLQPVFVAILRQLLDEAFAQAAARGLLDPPLLVVLDEAANVAPIADLDRLASTAAGHGVQLVSVFQDIAQIEARYGARAGTVVNNHRAKVLLSGISDPATLEHVSRLVGDSEQWSTSMSVDPYGGWSRHDSPQTRPLAPAAALRGIAPGEGVLIYGHLPPARITLRPWFADSTLRRRVAGGGQARDVLPSV